MVTAVIAGSTLVFHVPAALAGVVDWKDPASGDRQLTWSSQTANELKSTLENREVRLLNDDEHIGKGGGVVMHTFNDISIEVDRDSGVVEAIRITEKGEVVRKPLFDAFAAGKSVFKKGSDNQVMVTFSVSRAASGKALLSTKESATKVQFHFDVIIYSGDREVLDQVSLAYDATTLQPSVTFKKLRDYNYWANNGSSYELSNTTSYWATPVTYWQSSKQ